MIKLLAEVPLLKAIQRIKDEDEREQAIREQRLTIEEGSKAAIAKARQKSRNNEQSLSQYFRFFYPGRICAYPVAVMGMGIENIPTVFLRIQY